MLAVIGGSGFNRWDALQITDRLDLVTTYGAPSAPLVRGLATGCEVWFLARHGEPHRIAPHLINYRANIAALRDVGVRQVVAFASVGGIAASLPAGSVIVPDGMLDYTHSREHTFVDADADAVTHIDFTHPFDPGLRGHLLAAAAAAGIAVRDGGTYAATQGPRLESAAEIRRLERDGADIVGMTGMPEAALAREAGLAYAMLAVVANDAAGKGDSAAAVALDAAQAAFDTGMARAREVLLALLRAREGHG
ncbi:MAG: S-methyl-5'-thioinosine phosphorylase [Rhodocyclaceae bacterium]|nr:S-methyl-5'-thioinosine phosphorylase [Rhodocyclaceae bacterium]